MAQIYTQVMHPGDFQLDGTNPATLTTSLGTLELTTLDFGTGDTAYYTFRAASYTNGPLTLEIDWYARTGSSGTVVWEASLGSVSPVADSSDMETKDVGGVNYTQETHLGTVAKRLHRTTINITSVDGLNTNDLVIIKLERYSGSYGADSMTGDAAVVLVSLKYTAV